MLVHSTPTNTRNHSLHHTHAPNCVTHDYQMKSIQSKTKQATKIFFPHFPWIRLLQWFESLWMSDTVNVKHLMSDTVNVKHLVLNTVNVKHLMSDTECQTLDVGHCECQTLNVKQTPDIRHCKCQTLDIKHLMSSPSILCRALLRYAKSCMLPNTKVSQCQKLQKLFGWDSNGCMEQLVRPQNKVKMLPLPPSYHHFNLHEANTLFCTATLTYRWQHPLLTHTLINGRAPFSLNLFS